MITKRPLTIFGIIALTIGLPFAFLHLIASPNDAQITLIQRLTAAIANYFGPWGVAVVRLVDFPNAGLRSFSWALAAGLTLVGAILLIIRLKTQSRPWQITLALFWGLFVLTWFGIGFSQIAAGLL
jgi:hypothetical protein